MDKKYLIKKLINCIFTSKLLQIESKIYETILAFNKIEAIHD